MIRWGTGLWTFLWLSRKWCRAQMIDTEIISTLLKRKGCSSAMGLLDRHITFRPFANPASGWQATCTANIPWGFRKVFKNLKSMMGRHFLVPQTWGWKSDLCLQWSSIFWTSACKVESSSLPRECQWWGQQCSGRWFPWTVERSHLILSQLGPRTERFCFPLILLYAVWRLWRSRKKGWGEGKSTRVCSIFLNCWTQELKSGDVSFYWNSDNWPCWYLTPQ